MNRAVKYGILIFALALITLGIIVGEPLEVFRKAAAVCLECIGVG